MSHVEFVTYGLFFRSDNLFTIEVKTVSHRDFLKEAF